MNVTWVVSEISVGAQAAPRQGEVLAAGLVGFTIVIKQYKICFIFSIFYVYLIYTLFYILQYILCIFNIYFIHFILSIFNIPKSMKQLLNTHCLHVLRTRVLLSIHHAQHYS